ncbi:MAG: O-antigen ligase family protein [Pseudomonadota bacterium]|nr:O-antigen ligase family protein [Pseudomonadota bacterium]
MRLLYALPIVFLPNTLHLPPNVAVGITIALLVVAAIFSRKDPPYFPKAGYLTPALVGLALAMLLGYIIGQWNDTSTALADLLRAKYAITYPLLYLAYRRSGLDLRATRQLIVLVLAVAALAGLEAVTQGLQFNLDKFADQQRATGPFGDANTANRAGVFFAIFLPILVAVALQPGHRGIVRWLSAAGGAILIAGILFTFSRQAYLIALFGILILLFHRGVPMMALASLVAVLAVGAGLLPESVTQRMGETRQVGTGGGISYDASTQSRLEIWGGALDMLADHPFGVGLGQFREHIGEYTVHSGMDAHNAFVLMLAETGPLGLAMMLWLIWRLMMLARGLRRSAAAGVRPEASPLAVGFTVAVVSMALGNMYGSPYVDGLVMYNFWILCGLMERYGIAQAHEVSVAAASQAPLPATARAAHFPLAARAIPGLSNTRRSLTPR